MGEKSWTYYVPDTIHSTDGTKPDSVEVVLTCKISVLRSDSAGKLG